MSFKFALDIVYFFLIVTFLFFFLVPSVLGATAKGQWDTAAKKIRCRNMNMGTPTRGRAHIPPLRLLHVTVPPMKSVCPLPGVSSSLASR